jgi:hypothetical protein
MKAGITALILVPSLLGTTAFGVHWLATRGYDRGFAWALLGIAAVIATLSIVMFVLSIDERISELEEQVRKVRDKSSDTTSETD